MVKKKLTIKSDVTETPVETNVNPDEIKDLEEDTKDSGETTKPDINETPEESVEEVKKISPAIEVKVYSSLVYLNHKIGNNIRFVNGSYSTINKTEQETIEKDLLFGQNIFLVNK